MFSLHMFDVTLGGGWVAQCSLTASPKVYCQKPRLLRPFVVAVSRVSLIVTAERCSIFRFTSRMCCCNVRVNSCIVLSFTLSLERSTCATVSLGLFSSRNIQTFRME